MSKKVENPGLDKSYTCQSKQIWGNAGHWDIILSYATCEQCDLCFSSG